MLGVLARGHSSASPWPMLFPTLFLPDTPGPGSFTSLRVCCIFPGLNAFVLPRLPPWLCPRLPGCFWGTGGVLWGEVVSFLWPSEGSLCARHWPLFLTCIQPCDPPTSPRRAGAGVRFYGSGHCGAEGCGPLPEAVTPSPHDSTRTSAHSRGALLHVLQPHRPPACESLKFTFSF